LPIQDYDQRTALPATDDTPAERLQYLREVSKKKPADLVPIFGQISHMSEAIHEKRPISTDQARKLGKLFHVDAGFFV